MTDYLGQPLGGSQIIEGVIDGPLEVSGDAQLDSNLTVDGNALVKGNMTVQGTLVSQDELEIKDPIAEFAVGNVGDAVNSGWITNHSGLYSGVLRQKGTDDLHVFASESTKPLASDATVPISGNIRMENADIASFIYFTNPTSTAGIFRGTTPSLAKSVLTANEGVTNLHSPSGVCLSAIPSKTTISVNNDPYIEMLLDKISCEKKLEINDYTMPLAAGTPGQIMTLGAGNQVEFKEPATAIATPADTDIGEVVLWDDITGTTLGKSDIQMGPNNILYGGEERLVFGTPVSTFGDSAKAKVMVLNDNVSWDAVYINTSLGSSLIANSTTTRLSAPGESSAITITPGGVLIDKNTAVSASLFLDEELRLGSMTDIQRDALTAEAGMLIWNTDSVRMEQYNGVAWVEVTPVISGTAGRVPVYNATGIIETDVVISGGDIDCDKITTAELNLTTLNIKNGAKDVLVQSGLGYSLKNSAGTQDAFTSNPGTGNVLYSYDGTPGISILNASVGIRKPLTMDDNEYFEMTKTTTANRDALTPDNGTMLWNSDENKLQVYDGTWNNLTYNTGTVTVTGGSFNKLAMFTADNQVITNSGVGISSLGNLQAISYESPNGIILTSGAATVIQASGSLLNISDLNDVTKISLDSDKTDFTGRTRFDTHLGLPQYTTLERDGIPIIDLRPGDVIFNTTNGIQETWNGAIWVGEGVGHGDVLSDTTALVNEIAVFNNVNGKHIKNSGVSINAGTILGHNEIRFDGECKITQDDAGLTNILTTAGGILTLSHKGNTILSSGAVTTLHDTFGAVQLTANGAGVIIANELTSNGDIKFTNDVRIKNTSNNSILLGTAAQTSLHNPSGTPIIKVLPASTTISHPVEVEGDLTLPSDVSIQAGVNSILAANNTNSILALSHQNNAILISDNVNTRLFDQVGDLGLTIDDTGVTIAGLADFSGELKLQRQGVDIIRTNVGFTQICDSGGLTILDISPNEVQANVDIDVFNNKHINFLTEVEIQRVSNPILRTVNNIGTQLYALNDTLGLNIADTVFEVIKDMDVPKINALPDLNLQTPNPLIIGDNSLKTTEIEIGAANVDVEVQGDLYAHDVNWRGSVESQVFSQITTVVGSNVISDDVDMLTGTTVGSRTIPANFLRAGSSIHIKMGGILTSNNDSCRCQIRLALWDGISENNISQASTVVKKDNGTQRAWELEYDIVCRGNPSASCPIVLNGQFVCSFDPVNETVRSYNGFTINSGNLADVTALIDSSIAQEIRIYQSWEDNVTGVNFNCAMASIAVCR